MRAFCSLTHERAAALKLLPLSTIWAVLQADLIELYVFELKKATEPREGQCHAAHPVHLLKLSSKNGS